METGKVQEMVAAVREYKLPTGVPNYPALYSIPSKDRIRDLAAQDYGRINNLIIGALTVVFEGMNLKRGMNAIQILTLSELIIESAGEDNLALEDLVLFLQNMLMGKYEMSYESIDIPKFMKLFEIYRQERWSTWRDYKWNEHLQYKGIGDVNRTAKGDPLSEHFSNLGESIHGLKDELNKTRKENNVIKMADKFYGDKTE